MAPANNKKKGKTMSLDEFLKQGKELSRSSCADQVGKSDLPTAPTRDLDHSKIPTVPPYTAYIGNLPYDIKEIDVMEFFKGLAVKGIRLPRDDVGQGVGRLKGFGYVEFNSRQDLIGALDKSELMIKGREIRVRIADSGPADRPKRPPKNSDRDRTDQPWRRPPGQAPPSDNQDRTPEPWHRPHDRAPGSKDRTAEPWRRPPGQAPPSDNQDRTPKPWSRPAGRAPRASTQDRTPDNWRRAPRQTSPSTSDPNPEAPLPAHRDRTSDE